jgi:hypothetical protein
MSSDDLLIKAMAVTACFITSPECSAFCRVRSTSFPASSALLVEEVTVTVISSTADAVSSTEAACCSARLGQIVRGGPDLSGPGIDLLRRSSDAVDDIGKLLQRAVEIPGQRNIGFRQIVFDAMGQVLGRDLFIA